MHILYGDGIHDDTLAIQELIDSGIVEVSLPSPKEFYLISKPLELPSNFKLILPRFAEIRLAPDSNCVMIKNKMVRDFGIRLNKTFLERPIQSHLWGYINDYSPDAPCKNIEICGGIWNCNNQEQLPNPERGMSFEAREFYGCGMLFYNVSNLKLSNLTVKDPSQWGVSLDKVSYFTVEDIAFDYNKGNPYPINMDGVHLNGNCHNGVIRNLKGTCYDDLVAVNAHEGSVGDITNITISDIFAEYCHSAVRLLAVSEKIENITISNVYGNFYQYCITFSKAYPGETTGCFDGITINNIYAAKALPVEKGDFIWPDLGAENSRRLFHFYNDTVVKNISISHCHRREKTVSQELMLIEKDARVENMVLDHITCENYTDKPYAMICNQGTIEHLSTKNLYNQGGTVLVNEGTIKEHKENLI